MWATPSAALAGARKSGPRGRAAMQRSLPNGRHAANRHQALGATLLPTPAGLPSGRTMFRHMHQSRHSAPSTRSMPHQPWTQPPRCRVNPLEHLRASAASAEAASQPSSSSSSSGAESGKAGQVTVIGAGPAGLATAIMLARRGYTNITVYERMPEPPAPGDLSVWGDFDTSSDRLYMIGLNGRGQAVLRSLDVMDRIDRHSAKVTGRMDWTPGNPKPRKQRYSNRTYVTRCIQRDRLASCLLEEVRERYSDSIQVFFNVECNSVEWRKAEEADGKAGKAGREVCVLKMAQMQTTAASEVAVTVPAAVAARAVGGSVARVPVQAAAAAQPATALEWAEQSDFVIGADGAGSAVREEMERVSGGRFSVRRFPDKNVIVYRTIPLFLPKPGQGVPGPAVDDEGKDMGWDGDLNYSARTKTGLNIDALPTPEGPLVGVVLYKPGCEAIKQLQEEGAQGSTQATEAARRFFQQYFPMILPALREDDLARFAVKKDSNLPRFSYSGPVLHHGETTCLVGDTIHTVKPYFGQGVNSAFEDIQVLSKALEQSGDDVKQAVKKYSQLRAKDAEALVTLSHSLDGGFLTFIGPLILDSMLNRWMPWLFSPNIIASLQNEQWRFSQIRERKRVDRAMQCVLLGAMAFIAWQVVSRLLTLVVPAVTSVLKKFVLQA